MARSSSKSPSETQSGRVFRVREKGVQPGARRRRRRFVLPRRGGDSREPWGRAKGVVEQIPGLSAGRQPSASRALLLRGRQEILHRRGRLVAAPDTGRYSASPAAWANRLVRALRRTRSQFRLSGAMASPGSSRLGQDAAAEGAPSGVRITADCAAALNEASVAVDFSSGSAVAAHAQACAQARVPLLVGATGFDAPSRAALQSGGARDCAADRPEYQRRGRGTAQTGRGGHGRA